MKCSGGGHQNELLVDRDSNFAEALLGVERRLQRNLFGELPAALSASSDPPAPAPTQDAELSRLSDALVGRIALFLRGVEFARLAQVNKVRWVSSLLRKKLDLTAQFSESPGAGARSRAVGGAHSGR